MDDYIKKVGQSIDDAIDFFLKRINEPGLFNKLVNKVIFRF